MEVRKSERDDDEKETEVVEESLVSVPVRSSRILSFVKKDS